VEFGNVAEDWVFLSFDDGGQGLGGWMKGWLVLGEGLEVSLHLDGVVGSVVLVA
jgi:hypothetical protein